MEVDAHPPRPDRGLINPGRRYLDHPLCRQADPRRQHEGHDLHRRGSFCQPDREIPRDPITRSAAFNGEAIDGPAPTPRSARIARHHPQAEALHRGCRRRRGSPRTSASCTRSGTTVQRGGGRRSGACSSCVTRSNSSSASCRAESGSADASGRARRRARAHQRHADDPPRDGTHRQAAPEAGAPARCIRTGTCCCYVPAGVAEVSRGATPRPEAFAAL